MANRAYSRQVSPFVYGEPSVVGYDPTTRLPAVKAKVRC